MKRIRMAIWGASGVLVGTTAGAGGFVVFGVLMGSAPLTTIKAALAAWALISVSAIIASLGEVDE